MWLRSARFGVGVLTELNFFFEAVRVLVRALVFCAFQDTMKIHFENNAPFLTISSITRTIEVSHWGNIAVEETIDLRHTGAVLKGPFSRYDYQRQSDSGISSVKSFKVGNHK